MNKKKKLYAIGIGGIGVSGLTRYYLSQGWEVSGSDSTNSELIESLISEWCDIIIWSSQDRISDEIDLVIYTEAIPSSQWELLQAQKLWIKTLKYNLALAEVVNTHKLIAVTGTHGKSTTSSMVSKILLDSEEDFKSIVGTLLQEFDKKNYFGRGESSYFVIEACEHKEHFLAYKPSVGVITNIEYDHADYFKTPQDYVDAFEKFINNILPGGFCIINADDTNCKSLIWKRPDIHYILVRAETFSTIFPWENIESNIETYPEIVMQVPWKHILFDAKISYIVSHMIGVPEITSLESLESYRGVWRRMERLWTTKHGNILISDYGHHPTEIRTTLSAIKAWYRDKRLYVVFQPHQYSRTIELLDGFTTCFVDADTVVIPDIYESRDSDENKVAMNTDILVQSINHDNVINGEWLENTSELINTYDSKNPHSSVILLLWAGSVDTLRYKIKTD